MRKGKHKQPQYVTTKNARIISKLEDKILFHLHVKGTVQNILLSNAGMWGGFLDKHLCQK